MLSPLNYYNTSLPRLTHLYFGHFTNLMAVYAFQSKNNLNNNDKYNNNNNNSTNNTNSNNNNN